MTAKDLSPGGKLPEPMIVVVNNVDWDQPTSRRAAVELLDVEGNEIQLIDYEGANLSVEWTVGHRYLISSCNVTGGEQEEYITLAPSKRTQIELLGVVNESAYVLFIGDTHIGRKWHPKSGDEIDPLGSFTTAVEYGISEAVEAVVHVGDIFHETLSSQEAELLKKRVLVPLENANIPFYYVEGNHTAPAGENLLKESPNCSNLNLLGHTVGNDTRLFGINHYPSGNLPWDGIQFPQKSSESKSILVLHQTLQQLTGPGEDSVDLNRINKRLSEEFDLVICGHHHDAMCDMWHGIPIMYTGASAKLSTNHDPTDEVAWLVNIKDQTLIPQKYDIRV